MQSYSSKIMPGLQVVSSTTCIRTVQSSQSCSFKSSRYKLPGLVFDSELVTAVTKKRQAYELIKAMLIMYVVALTSFSRACHWQPNMALQPPTSVFPPCVCIYTLAWHELCKHLFFKWFLYQRLSWVIAKPKKLNFVLSVQNLIVEYAPCV